MKNFIILLSVIFGFALKANAQNVLVNPGNGSYPTLKAAFDAINAGTHTGAITVDIVANTIEPLTAQLNDSGTGSVNYSSVLIRPVSPVSVTGLDIATVKLARTRNVTIDGRINGSGRYLTIGNNLSVYNSCAIWVANGLNSEDSSGAKNNVIRNCELFTSVRVDLTEDFSYGIIFSGVTSGFTPGRNNNHNQILENRIIRARYGIVMIGGINSSLSRGNLISGNIIGPDTPGSDNIGKNGIYVTFQDSCTISNNHVQNVGGTFAGTFGAGYDRIGIGAGSDQWASTPTATYNKNFRIINNIVHGIKEERTKSAVGIICATGYVGVPTNNLIANNQVYDVLANSISGDGCIGIGLSGNNTYDITAYNSIYMVGDLDPPGVTSATQTASGIRLALAIDSNNTIINNSIYVNLTSDNTALKKCCIQMPTANYVFGTRGLDYNDYYYPAANTEMVLGATGPTSLATGFYPTLAVWKNLFVPVNQDGNSINADPLYSLLLPHYLMPINGTSPLLSEALPIAEVTTDILGLSRDASLPTIGCYEYDANSNPIQKFSLKFNFEACPDAGNVTVELRNSTSPYAIVESVSAIAGGNTEQPVSFSNAVNGVPYYLVVRSVNLIETWSASTISFSSSFASYNFTSAIGQAYGNNQVLSGGIPSLYQGDANQDGFINLQDVLLAYNDASAFITGPDTDFNCDGITDLSDIILAANNATNFITVQKP